MIRFACDAQAWSIMCAQVSHLQSHALALVMLRLSSPSQEGTHIFGHLTHGSRGSCSNKVTESVRVRVPAGHTDRCYTSISMLCPLRDPSVRHPTFLVSLLNYKEPSAFSESTDIMDRKWFSPPPQAHCSDNTLLLLHLSTLLFVTRLSLLRSDLLQ